MEIKEITSIITDEAIESIKHWAQVAHLFKADQYQDWPFNQFQCGIIERRHKNELQTNTSSVFSSVSQ